MWNHIKIVRIFKSLLSKDIKIFLIRILVALQSIYYIYLLPKRSLNISKEKRNIFVLLSTDYSNLGDHAMTYAHINLLKREFPDSNIIEVLVSDTIKNLRDIEENIKVGDILTLKGGGNIGIEYFREELIRRKIIKQFKNNKIILFPQTVYFPKTKLGDKEFCNTIKNFKGHSNLYLYFRDKKTFELMNEYIKEKIYLVPDIVMSLGVIGESKMRKGAMTCLRADIEGVYTERDKSKIIDKLKEYYENIVVTDTIKDYKITVDEREKELKETWKLFLAAEIVVTDRLHGMIFAALTKTPCLVLKTYNYKLTAQYEWLKNINYIRHIDINSDLDRHIQELKKMKIEEVDFESYKKYFDSIIETIKVDEGILCEK